MQYDDSFLKGTARIPQGLVKRIDCIKPNRLVNFNVNHEPPWLLALRMRDGKLLAVDRTRVTEVVCQGVAADLASVVALLCQKSVTFCVMSCSM